MQYGKNDLNLIKPLLRVLYRESYDSFALFDSDYKHLAFLLSNACDIDRNSSSILNNYALYLDKKEGEKVRIENELTSIENIIESTSSITPEDLVCFNQSRARINTHIRNAEKTLKNSLILFSELFEVLPQRSKNIFIHYRKSSDDEMEILKSVKNQYLQTSINFFSRWFDFRDSKKYSGLTLKNISDLLFRSTMVYIDYSTETKFQRNLNIPRLENILLPHTSMLMPKNLSTISHEINYYILLQMKKYLKPELVDVITSFYENLDQVFVKLDITAKRDHKNYITEVIVDKAITDFITLFTAGPNYAMNLFCLLSKEFSSPQLAVEKSPVFARILSMIEMSILLLESKSRNIDSDCKRDYLKMFHYMKIFTECSLENIPSRGDSIKQNFIMLNDAISKKLVRLIRDELIPTSRNESLIVPYSWIPSAAFYDKGVSLKQLFKGYMNSEVSSFIPDYTYFYNLKICSEVQRTSEVGNTDWPKKNEDNSYKENTQTSAIRSWGAILAPELMWEIENKDMLSQECESKPLLHHLPQVRIARMMSCGLRVTFLRVFFNYYQKCLFSHHQDKYLIPLAKPNYWLFLDVNWRNLSRIPNKSNSENLIAKFESYFSGNLDKILSEEKIRNHYMLRRNEESEGQNNLQGLHCSICRNNYFLSLDEPVTRYKLEKWPLWFSDSKKEAEHDQQYMEETFNSSIKRQFFEFSTDEDQIQSFYTYSDVVAEKIYTNVSGDQKNIKEGYKLLILGKLMQKQFGNDFLELEFEKWKKYRQFSYTKEIKQIGEIFNNTAKKDFKEKVTQLKNKMQGLIEDLKTQSDIMEEDGKKQTREICEDLTSLFSDSSEKPNSDDLIYQLKIFRIKLLNMYRKKDDVYKGKKEIQYVYPLVTKIYYVVKELFELATIKSFIELVCYLESCGQTFEVFLTNSWSDFGVVLYPSSQRNDDNEEPIIDIANKLYKEYFHFSHTRILIPSSLNEKDSSSIDDIGQNKKMHFNLILEATNNECFDSSSLLTTNEIRQSIGLFDFNCTFSHKKNIVQAYFKSKEKLVEILNNSTHSGICEIQNISSCLQFENCTEIEN